MGNFNRSNTTNKTFLLPDTVKYLSGDENLYFVPVNTFKYVTNDIDTSIIDGDGNIPFTEVKFIDVTFEDPTKAWIETIKEARMAGIVYNQYNGLNKNKTILKKDNLILNFVILFYMRALFLHDRGQSHHFGYRLSFLYSAIHLFYLPKFYHIHDKIPVKSLFLKKHLYSNFPSI